MKNAVAYSLAPDQQNSEAYYRRVQEFTDEVLGHASDSLMTSITEFTDYLRKYKLEELRSDEEYILELLNFGLLWKTYGEYSLTVRMAPFLTLSRMAEWRKRHQKLKRYGVCAQCVLLDYSGCKKHWHCDGVSTSLNIRELKRILRGQMTSSLS